MSNGGNGLDFSGATAPVVGTQTVYAAPDLTAPDIGSGTPDMSGGLMPAIPAPVAPGAVTPVTGTADGSGLLSEFATTLTSLASVGVGLAAQTGVFGSAAQTAATKAAATAAKPATGVAAAVSSLSLTTIVLIIGAVVAVGVLLYVFLWKKN